MGEGTPQSSALTEGEFVPDSPALSPIELKQELPKYLPALQVRCPPTPAGSAFLITIGPVAESRGRVRGGGLSPGVVNMTGWAQPLASLMSMVMV